MLVFWVLIQKYLPIKQSNLNNYFNGPFVSPSVTKNFFRLNRLGITPWLLGSIPVARGWPRVTPGHAAPLEELARARRALSSETNDCLYLSPSLGVPKSRILTTWLCNLLVLPPYTVIRFPKFQEKTVFYQGILGFFKKRWIVPNLRSKSL